PGGSSAGRDATFSTSRSPGSPTAQASDVPDDGAVVLPLGGAATGPVVASTGVVVEQTAADALGFVSSGGGGTSVWVEYGPDAAYGQRTAAQALPAAAGAQLVDVALA